MTNIWYARGPFWDNSFLFFLLFNLRWAQLYVSLVIAVFAIFLLKLPLISFVLGFIQKTCKACGAMRNTVQAIGAIWYILKYTSLQILHTYFTIQVYHLRTLTIDSQTPIISICLCCIPWSIADMTSFYNMFVSKYTYLEIRRNVAGTNNKVKILFKKALAQDVQNKGTFF